MRRHCLRIIWASGGEGTLFHGSWARIEPILGLLDTWVGVKSDFSFFAFSPIVCNFYIFQKNVMWNYNQDWLNWNKCKPPLFTEFAWYLHYNQPFGYHAQQKGNYVHDSNKMKWSVLKLYKLNKFQTSRLSQQQFVYVWYC